MTAPRHPASGRPGGEPGGDPAGAEAGGPPAGPPVSLNVGPTGPRSPLNTGGLIYGTIVAAVAVAIGSGHGDTPGDIVNALVSTVLIYWLAHVYTATLSGRRPGTAPPLLRRAGAAARHESTILLGGLPLFAVVTVLWIAGLPVVTIAAAALAAGIGILALEGFLASRQAGVRGWRMPAESVGAAVFGALVALLMAALHT